MSESRRVKQHGEPSSPSLKLVKNVLAQALSRASFEMTSKHLSQASSLGKIGGLLLGMTLPIGMTWAEDAPQPAPVADTAVAAPATDSTPTAATEAAPKLEAVTVTASRRTENIKNVPVSVSLIRGEQLNVLNSGGQDIRVLAAKTPSLNIESSNGRSFPRLYIRGYGNTDFNTYASQPVSLVYDDIVQENAVLKGYPMFDLAAVEVLRGPQGTLFGRNSPAGVVKFDSVKPTLDNKVSGYYSLSDGTYNTANAEGAINIPLNDVLAVRVSGLVQHRDDWVKDTVTGGKLEGYDEKAGRIQLLYKPSDDFSALLNVHARDMSGSARLFRANIIQPGTNKLIDGFDPAEISTDAHNKQELQTSGTNLHLTWNFDQFKISSITGYETINKYFTRGDIDGGYGAVFAPPSGPGLIPFPVETSGGVNDHKQLTQEFRIESKSGQPLNWQAGVYYFWDDITGESIGYNTLSNPSGQKTTDMIWEQDNKAWAAFGSASYDLTDKFKVRGGIRYTHDERNFDVKLADKVPMLGAKSADADVNKVNWDVSGTYAITPDVNLYARVATGFRAPSIAPPTEFVPITVAQAETVTSYEAGFKSDLFDKRARLNFSVFRYDVKNQQLTVVGGQNNSNVLINADKSIGQGAEVDFQANLTEHLKFTLGTSYNDTEIKDPNLYVAPCRTCTVTDPEIVKNGKTLVSINGNPLPQAPKWISNVTLRYGIPLNLNKDDEFFVYTDWSYRSSANFFLYESAEFKSQPILEGGLRVGYNWDAGKYEAAVFARNITNTIRTTSGIDFNNLTGMINEPRMVGVQFKQNF
ncbi:TonB-dependent receptor [Aquirhabdus parva]|nr:TonB-dependent receptor [Aquirhabdus parva]